MSEDIGAGRRSQTGTTLQARADARAREGTIVEAMPFLPPETSPYVPTEVDPAALVWAESVAGGGYTHATVARGTKIRLDDPSGDACAHVVLLNALNPAERLNVADTQKIPWQAYLGAGHPLLSGDGRVLATITADTSGRHDAFCGAGSGPAMARKFGSYQVASDTPAGQELLKVAAVKEGLTARDVPQSVSFFQGIRAAEDGSLEWLGSAGPGRFIELLAEVPLVILIANAPHPLDPSTHYREGLLRIHAWPDAASTVDSPWWSQTPERRRAYLNTDQYLATRGLR